MNKTERVFMILIVVALAGAFALFALDMASSGAGILAAGLSTLLFGALCVGFVGDAGIAIRAEAPLSPDSLLGARSLRRENRHPWLRIILFVVLTRVFLYVVGYAASTIFTGYSGGILDTLKAVWQRTDSPSYMGIAENWYVTEGDPRFHIVFFPLFPLVIRAFNLIFQSSFVSAQVISFLSTVGASILMFETAALDMEKDAAMRSVRYFILAPAAFFLAAPMTEALFALLCLGCVYLIRKKRFLLGAVCGALAAFTRSPGVLLFAYAFCELMLGIFEAKRHGTLASEKKTHILRGLTLFIIPLGLVAYFVVNYAVTGDPFMFAKYQSEHWNQGLGLFMSTASYQTDYAISAFVEGDLRTGFGLFLPNLIYAFAALAIMLCAHKKIRPSYTAYFIVYFAVTIGATWLLSAPRYLMAAFPLPIALAAVTRDKRIDGALTLICFAGQVVYLSMYAIGWPVY